MPAVLTRRQLLRRVGPAVGTVALGVSAGCVGGERPPAGADGTTTLRPYEGPPYGRWVPTPAALERSRLPFSAIDLASMTVQSDTLPRGIRRSPHVDGWAPVAVDWRDVELSLWLQGSFVIDGSYEPAAVVETVSGTTGWTDVDDYRGYDLLAREDRSRAIAVGASAVVIGRASADDITGVEAAERLVDTGRGARARLVTASGAVSAFVDEVGDGSIVQWHPQTPPAQPTPAAGRFTGQVGLGRWGEVVDAETTAVKLVFVFEDAAAAERADLDAYVEANRDGGPLAAWSDVRTYRNGRLGVIAGTVAAW